MKLLHFSSPTFVRYGGTGPGLLALVPDIGRELPVPFDFLPLGRGRGCRCWNAEIAEPLADIRAVCDFCNYRWRDWSLLSVTKGRGKFSLTEVVTGAYYARPLERSGALSN
jgi:hypothetical protein